MKAFRSNFDALMANRDKRLRASSPQTRRAGADPDGVGCRWPRPTMCCPLSEHLTGLKSGSGVLDLCACRHRENSVFGAEPLWYCDMAARCSKTGPAPPRIQCAITALLTGMFPKRCSSAENRGPSRSDKTDRCNRRCSMTTCRSRRLTLLPRRR